MKRKSRNLLIVTVCLAVLILAFWAVLQSNFGSAPDYDDPESLFDLAERTEQYILRANPDRESTERAAALKEFEDIALLDVSDAEKARILRERFPEESFWTDDMRGLLKTAEAGDPGAQYELGCLYLMDSPYWDDGVDLERGRCIVKSEVLAVKWFRRAAMQGHVKAQNRLACFAMRNGYTHPLLKNHLTVSDKVRKAAEREIREWVEQARNNRDPVVIRWERILSTKDGEPDGNELEALALARKAAGRGQVKAMLCLADWEIVPEEEQIEWLRRAAGLGSVEAMLEIASLCEDRAQTRDGDKAVNNAEKAEAAAAGNEDMAEAKMWRRKAFEIALKRLDAGDMEDFSHWIRTPACKDHLDDYLDGEDKTAFVRRILNRFLELLDRSPAGGREFLFVGSVSGALSLSSILPPDENNAVRVKLLRLRAEASGFISQEGYAEAMLTGVRADIPQDKAEAVRLLRKLAGFGQYWARIRLGQCYLEGDGVPKDRAEGIKWLKKAAEQGEDFAMNELSEALWDAGPLMWPEALDWSIRTNLYPKYGSFSEFCLDKLKALWDSALR